MNHDARSKVALIAPALLGVGAAVLTTLAIHRPGARAPGAVPASSPPSAVAAMSASPSRSAELAAIERRLAGLEAQERRAEGAPAPAPEEAPPDPEQAWREVRRQHDEALQRHREEPVDNAWSGQATSLLREDLGALADGRTFRLADLNCKTISCVATLEWPSFATASREARDVIAAPHRVNCATTVLTPAPDDPAAPYRAEIFFDCAALRAGLVESVATAAESGSPRRRGAGDVDPAP